MVHECGHPAHESRARTRGPPRGAMNSGVNAVGRDPDPFALAMAIKALVPATGRRRKIGLQEPSDIDLRHLHLSPISVDSDDGSTPSGLIVPPQWGRQPVSAQDGRTLGTPHRGWCERRDRCTKPRHGGPEPAIGRGHAEDHRTAFADAGFSGRALLGPKTPSRPLAQPLQGSITRNIALLNGHQARSAKKSPRSGLQSLDPPLIKLPHR
jgi:hypothetical protein